MKNINAILLSVVLVGIGGILSPATSQAQQIPQPGKIVYDSRVSNPFVFCSLPRPCRLCKPWRSIWDKICRPAHAEAQVLQPLTDEAMSKVDPKYTQDIMQANIFRKEYYKVTGSMNALARGDSQEVNDYISWLGRQPAPTGHRGTMQDYWNRQGVYDVQSDPNIAQYARQNIEKTNDTIMDMIYKGSLPPKKPWESQ